MDVYLVFFAPRPRTASYLPLMPPFRMGESEYRLPEMLNASKAAFSASHRLRFIVCPIDTRLLRLHLRHCLPRRWRLFAAERVVDDPPSHGHLTKWRG